MTEAVNAQSGAGQGPAPFNVAGKSCFITGGTAGIGLATAKRLAAAGARVTISGRRATGQAIADEIGARFVALDVTDAAALDTALRETVAVQGALDILFNNAGTENTGPTLEEADGAAFQRLIDLNLVAAYNTLHHGAPRMADGGSIINTASVAATISMPGYAQYGASKAAVVSLTRSAALELAPRGIRVNAICPGSVWSEMLPPDHPEVAAIEVLCPAARVGEAGEVAALVHFLASDDSRYVSGAVIPIDGGLSAGFGYPLLEALFGDPQDAAP